MDSENKIVIYQTEDNQTQVDVRLDEETVWLTQYQLSDLFQTERTSITKHISSIYKTKELEKDSTCAKFAQVQFEGNRNVQRYITYYNLDMIISVGYRVNSIRGTQFRIWANKILREYLVQGYSLNNKLMQTQKEKILQLKNHSFVDGNKRIAAAVLLYFLNKNNYFEKHKLNNDLLTTLTLLIAISNPQDKDLLVNIVSVILQRNI